MALSKDVISTVKEKADIVEIIGERVHLTPSGSDWVGLCPFHNEKTPSFRVNPTWNTYHCFGCGAGGSAIDFVMNMDHLGFPEAVRSLAERFGVEVPGDVAPRQRSRAGDVLEAAGRYYHALLMERPEGETARRYLTERGFHEPDWEAFSMGFALNQWQGFVDHATSLGYTMEEMVASGLVRQNTTGRAYDMLRNRVVFPIRNERGAIIAFGGRVIDPTEQPKYLNTPETTLYQKNKVLFGLYEGRDVIRTSGRAVLVEGYLDVIRMHQAGFGQAVATCGTALSTEHVALLQKRVGQAVLLFDGDSAGIKAALRSAPLFLNKGVEARVAMLPGGMDPDDFLRREGEGPFAELLERADPILEFLVHQLASQNGKSVQGREKTLEALAPVISQVEKTNTRDLTIRFLSDLVGISPDTVFSMLTAQSNREAASAALGAPTALTGRRGRHQRRFLRLLLTEPSLISHARGLVKPEDMEDARLTKLLQRIFGFDDTEFAQVSPDELMEWYPEMAGLIREVLLDDQRHQAAIKDARRQMDNEVIHIKEALKEQLFQRFKEVSGTAEEEEAFRLYKEVREELESLKTGFRQPRMPREELRLRPGNGAVVRTMAD